MVGFSPKIELGFDFLGCWWWFSSGWRPTLVASLAVGEEHGGRGMREVSRSILAGGAMDWGGGVSARSWLVARDSSEGSGR